MRHGSRLVHGVFASGTLVALFVTLTILLPGRRCPDPRVDHRHPDPLRHRRRFGRDGRRRLHRRRRSDHRERGQHHVQRSGRSGLAPARASLQIVVSGNMEMQAGSAILAENTVGSGSGGKITIAVGGNLILRGPCGAAAAPGSRAATSPAAEHRQCREHRDHRRQCRLVAPDRRLPDGARPEIIANSANRAEGHHDQGGEDGRRGWPRRVVRRHRRHRRQPAPRGRADRHRRGLRSHRDRRREDQQPRGRPRRGSRAPGGRLRGARVRAGRVDGHWSRAADQSPQRLRGAGRPDKPANAVACVQIWAGDSLIIDAKNHPGEINADTGGSPGVSWIDLLRAARSP